MALRRALATAFGRLGGGLCEQRRAYIAVDVHHNNVDKALKSLKRKLNEEGLVKEWRSNEFHIKPCEERKVSESASLRRLSQREFKAQLRWIMRRKARGF